MVDELVEPAPRSLAEYWEIAWRRRWYILLPLFCCWAIVWCASWFLPTTYRSEATILVEHQTVPQQYVASNVSISLQDRLQNMTQQILSRTRLQATIDRFHLYPSRKSLSGLAELADPVEQMRKDIKIDVVDSPARPGELTSFKIQYSARSPLLAQRVNSELTGMFIDENLKAQQQLSENTTAFLDNQLADARAKLGEQEAKMQAFKAKHFGDLPSQLQGNVQILAGLQGQLQSTERDLDSAKQQRTYLDSLNEQYEAIQASSNAVTSTGNSPAQLRTELSDLQLKLADARSRYTEDFPDVIALKSKIAETQQLLKQAEAEIAAKPNSSATSPRMYPPAASATDTAVFASGGPTGPGSNAPISMVQIKSQLKANDLEISNLQQNKRDLQSQIAAYQARLNMTPETEQELAEVSRGYEESLTNYNSLLQKKNQSQLATSLEQRQEGEQFRVLDPPNLPDKPSDPNHLLISLAGLGAGLCMGLMLIAYLEISDPRVRKQEDLIGVVSARLLVSIPHLTTPSETRKRLLLRAVEVAGAILIVVTLVAGNLYSLLKG